MNKLFFLLFSITALLSSCNNDKERIFNELYSNYNLPNQLFSIDNSVDNIFSGGSGTRIRIPKNTFVDSAGNPVTGNVEITMIEVLTPADMALTNMTTTFNNKPLQSGGMIYLNAQSGNKDVRIGPDKSILVCLPTDSVLSGMSVFEGRSSDSSGIIWSDPVPLPEAKKGEGESSEFTDIFERTTNITYTVDGFTDKNIPDTVNLEVSRIGWAGTGLKISKDSTFQFGKYTIHFKKNNWLQKWSQVYSNKKGTNSFAEDKNANYIFSVKKLGWANIDKLLDDPRTKEVDLITSIDNAGDFKFVYVTLITKNMYLPGYQRKDGTYSFSHDDDEKQQLPVGESATIMGTAYKNDVPYLGIKKITISEKLNVSFKLDETTTEKMKQDLKEKI
jgi:hypothetical protein